MDGISGARLGAQALGHDGPAVDKRISALAVALQMGATIYDLEEAELCYAPQFGSAKDAVNFAGMVAADVLRGDMPLAHWPDTEGAFLLDVRQPVELLVGSVPGAVNIPLGELRALLPERCDRDGAGLRGGVVPRSIEHGGVGGDALAVDRGAGVIEPETGSTMGKQPAARHLSRRTLALALGVALLADGVSVFLTLTPPLQWSLDAVTAPLLFVVLGWHWILLPGFVMEAIPGLSVFPFWVLVVAAVATWGTVRPGRHTGRLQP